MILPNINASLPVYLLVCHIGTAIVIFSSAVLSREMEWPVFVRVLDSGKSDSGSSTSKGHHVENYVFGNSHCSSLPSDILMG